MRSAASASDERPLVGRTVVVCRAEAEAAPLLAALESLGASTVALPLHRFAAPTDGGAALDAAIANIGAYTWLAVTSANGARAVASRLTDGIPKTVSVAAVGPATADALAELAIHVDLVPNRATAADLVAAFPHGEAGSRVLAPLNEAAADTLAGGLVARGYIVDRVDAYRMLPLTQTSGDVTSGDDTLTGQLDCADAVLFTSPSQVDAFITRFGIALVPPVVACIGPRTSAAAEVAGLTPISPPTTHTSAGLVDTLVASLRTEAVVPPSRPLDSPEKRNS